MIPSEARSLGATCIRYAVLGVQLFAFVGAGEFLHESRNFHTVLSASEVLLECAARDHTVPVVASPRLVCTSSHRHHRRACTVCVCVCVCVCVYGAGASLAMAGRS